MSEPNPFEIAHRRLCQLGVKLELLPGEYRVRGIWQTEAAWEAFDTLAEAEARGDELTAERPLPEPLARTGRRRRGQPVYRTPKAFLKAMRKRHNRRRWAAMGKIAGA